MEKSSLCHVEHRVQELKNVLRKRLLDLCFKEGWTTNETTQNNLFWFCWLKVRDEINLSKWTQSFLRKLYYKFKSQKPNEEWNTGPISDKRQVWSIEQALRMKRHKPPTWEDVQNVISNGGLVSLYSPVNLSESEKLQHKNLVNKHLDVLQPDWLPDVSITSNNNNIWREEVMNFYFKASSYFPRGRIPNPTLGFVHQLLQDMETTTGFLTRARFGGYENRFGQKHITNSDTNHSVSFNSEDSESSFSAVVARLDEEMENTDLLSGDIVQQTLEEMDGGDTSSAPGEEMNKSKIINQVTDKGGLNQSNKMESSITETTTPTFAIPVAINRTNDVEDLEDLGDLLTRVKVAINRTKDVEDLVDLPTKDMIEQALEMIDDLNDSSSVPKEEINESELGSQAHNKNELNIFHTAMSSIGGTEFKEVNIPASRNRVHTGEDLKATGNLQTEKKAQQTPTIMKGSNVVTGITKKKRSETNSINQTPFVSEKKPSHTVSSSIIGTTVTATALPAHSNKANYPKTIDIIDLTEDVVSQTMGNSMKRSNNVLDDTVEKKKKRKISCQDADTNKKSSPNVATSLNTATAIAETAPLNPSKKAHECKNVDIVDLTEDAVPKSTERIQIRVCEQKLKSQIADRVETDLSNAVSSSTAMTTTTATATSVLTNENKSNTATPFAANNATMEITTPSYQSNKQSKDQKDDNLIKRLLGARVYAEYPENKEWYWGLITKVCLSEKGSPCFSVLFDDGDTADNLSGKNIITEAEYKIKWQYIFKKVPPKRPKHLSNPMINGKENRLLTQEKYTPSPPLTTVYTKSASLKDAAASIKKDSGTTSVDASGNLEESCGKLQNETAELSSQKETGSRVYCKGKNGNYCWGEIKCKSIVNGSIDQYKVQFDDGDIFEIKDIADRDLDPTIFTETEYKVILGKNPPKRIKNNSLPHLTSRELFNLRCKTCRFCEIEKCGRCFWCKQAERIKDRKSSCLQNMCSEISYERKKQPAPGFPSGWMFSTGNDSMFSEENLCGLLIRSPTGTEYSSLEDALQSCKNKCNIAKTQLLFQSYLGGSILYLDEQHQLHNKSYMEEWIDVDGNKKVLHGKITQCERDKVDESHSEFIIAFNENSRKDILAMGGHCGLEIPQTQKVNESKALGGHLAFNFKAGLQSLASKSNICAFRWMTPDMRIESLVSIEHDIKVPQLTLTWNGFRLVLSVRKSTIPGAGYGVFVECTSLVPGRKTMVLNESEMLDLGVYAPFRSQDLKLQSVFLLKNYVHALKCEEWSFDVGGKDDSLQYDITDDYTGDIHEIAAKHIPAYVNECKMENTPTVHARHDPQSAVHYLLGVQNKKFVLPADGTPSEIFINYGPDYERVRVRKNYSFLPISEQQSHKKTLSSEGAEYFVELCSFCNRDVSSCIRFFSDNFARENSDSSVIDRSLAVALLLRHRARILHSGMDTNNPFVIEFESDLKRCEDLIQRLLHLHQNKRLTELNKAQAFDILLRESITPLLHELEPSKVEKVVTKILDSNVASISFHEPISN